MATETYFVVRRRISGTERWEYLRPKKDIGSWFSSFIDRAKFYSSENDAKAAALDWFQFNAEVISVTITFPD